ncbi:MAG: bacillithiol biosynthesis cysteine-adding enzyme BshC [Saprospiraceae bacterium]|nr:bacillithiol biosynthesis cysteine-adding enzyme BshC [Saprospiraceae bacterium]
MNVHDQRLPFMQVPQLSQIDKAYATGSPKLYPFYQYATSYNSFNELIENKTFSSAQRKILVEQLLEQYKQVEASPAHANVQLLAKENTYTVTTAHQPSLATGPLYYVYKIINAIKLAKELSKQYPQYNFVPIFWSGDEDHDFEEVNHFQLFGQKVEWEDKQGGSVGQYSVETLKGVLEQVQIILGTSERGQEIYKILHEAYSNKKNYKEATFHLVHHLFAQYGLVFLDASKAAFKATMYRVFRSELEEHVSQKLVRATAQELINAGFKNQAYPRAINLFYLSKNQRNRIVKEGNNYQVLNSNLSFSHEEILEELENSPERFSPNVIIRPLFQESILPNLAYIGGGGELAYWLERKSQFEHFGIPFPMLIRRTSVLWVNARQTKQIQNFGLSVTDLFQDYHSLIKKYIGDNSSRELSLGDEKSKLSTIFKQLLDKVTPIDSSLKGSVLAQQTQVLKSIDKLEKRLIKAEKQKYEQQLTKLQKLQDKLFPNNGLQERKDNLWNFYFKYGQAFIDTLLEYLDPMQEDFLILTEENIEVV